jgi:hypothetical protein
MLCIFSKFSNFNPFINVKDESKNRDRDITTYSFEELNTMHRRYDSIFTWHIFSKQELEDEIRRRIDG